MPRILGVDLANEKKLNIALTKIYGVGRSNVAKILAKANMDGAKRVKDLTSEEVSRIQKVLETIPTEGALRKIVTGNIKRLKQIKAYRGLRHMSSLPVRGQRTRTNARTKRGKRMTVGALAKEAIQKAQDAKN